MVFQLLFIVSCKIEVITNSYTYQVQRFKVDSLVKSRIGERHCPFRKKGFDTGGVNPPEADKLFEELATSSWNLAAGVETPERGHRSEPI
jgi:hypothetical protein